MNDTTAVLSLVKLKFNIDHPSIEECYSFGYECAQAEVDEDSNPFTAGTTEYEQWSDGWWAGFYGEEPLFKFTNDIVKVDAPEQIQAANDNTFKDGIGKWILTAIEITGVIVVSAVVGYQLLDMVA